MGYTGVGRDDVIWSGNVGASAPKPIADSDLTRKDYVDSQTFWKRVGTILSPKTDGDDITTTGTGIFGKFGAGITTPSTNAHISVDGSTPNALLYSSVADSLLLSNSGNQVGLRLLNAENTTAGLGPAMVFLRSRGTLVSPTIVQNGDVLGALTVQGYSGTARRSSSAINFEVDGTPGASDMPGRIVFKTTPDGSTTLATRWTIDNAGDLKAGIAGTNAYNITTAGKIKTGEFEATKDAYFTGAGSGLPYGEIYGYEVASEITITASGIANKVQITSFATNGVSNLMTPDHTNDHITILKAGVYKLSCNISCESAAGGTADVFGFSAYKNNGATELLCTHANRLMAGGGGDVGSVGMDGLITCAVNDTIEVWVWNNTSTSNIVIDDICLNLIQVGG